MRRKLSARYRVSKPPWFPILVLNSILELRSCIVYFERRRVKALGLDLGKKEDNLRSSLLGPGSLLGISVKHIRNPWAKR